MWVLQSINPSTESTIHRFWKHIFSWQKFHNHNTSCSVGVFMILTQHWVCFFGFILRWRRVPGESRQNWRSLSARIGQDFRRTPQGTEKSSPDRDRFKGQFEDVPLQHNTTAAPLRSTGQKCGSFRPHDRDVKIDQDVFIETEMIFFILLFYLTIRLIKKKDRRINKLAASTSWPRFRGYKSGRPVRSPFERATPRRG